MAFLDEVFDINALPEGGNSFDPIPAGWYEAKITGAELKTTKAGTGKYIAVRYDIIGPTHEGRVVFGNLNIRNPSQKAEEIGRQQLGDIMRAIGLSRVQDTDELIGGRLMINLAVTQATEQYGAGNDIKGYRAADGAGSPAPQQHAPAASAAPAQQQQPAAQSSAPWAKRA